MARRVAALLVASSGDEDTRLRRLEVLRHAAERLPDVLRDRDVAGFNITVLISEPSSAEQDRLIDLWIAPNAGAT